MWLEGTKSPILCPLATTGYLLYTCLYMSPLGIKRAVAVLLIISPWIFIPGIFKDIIFIIAGILLFISTLDLRKKSVHFVDNQETESTPRENSPVI